MDRATNSPGASRPSFSRRLFSILLRTFFKLLYHEFAWAYDIVAWIVSLGKWQSWVGSIVPYIQGPALEIGFGPGHLLSRLWQNSVPVVGLDESRQMAGMAHRRLNRNGYHPGLVQGDAQRLPFAENSFHQVVMTFPAEFILKSTTLLEIRRVLRQDGSVLVLPVAWITGRRPLERLAAWVNHIAGQAPDWNPAVLEPVKDFGFEPSSQVIELPNSKVMLIRLAKQ